MADYYGTDTVVSELREDGLLITSHQSPRIWQMRLTEQLPRPWKTS